jgi:DNA polymerase-1
MRLICTIVLAHILDSDRSYKGGYALDKLVYHWLGVDLSKYYDSLKPYLHNNQDYGQIPLDITAEYACAQVQANRSLYVFCMQNMPPEAVSISAAAGESSSAPSLLNTEIDFTRVLFDIERAGLYLDPLEVKVAEFACLRKMLDIEDKLQARLGYCLNPNSSDQLYDLICNRYGQPVRKWTNADSDDNPTERSGPSFDKDALKEYREDIDTPPELKEIIKDVIAYKHESQHKGLFYAPWQELCVPADGLEKLRSRLATIHASYNQNVRSGRLSCSQPNEQQLDDIAKQLILCKPGYAMLSCDYSQVEYRLMGHYTNSPQIIAAYNADPDIDFHEFIRVECEIEHRKPAKTINFQVGFGGGKKKTVRLLMSNYLDMGIMLTAEQYYTKATAVYNRYHGNWPELKDTSRRAENVARNRGYIINLAGRRLHLPGVHHNVQWVLDKKTKQYKKLDRCHIAFNRVVQSSAADLAKERAVAIQPLLRELGAELIALVHDSFLFNVPLYYWVRSAAGQVVLDLTRPRPEAEIVDDCNRIRAELERTPFDLKVPIRCSAGLSRISWADAEDKKNVVDR